MKNNSQIPETDELAPLNIHTSNMARNPSEAQTLLSPDQSRTADQPQNSRPGQPPVFVQMTPQQNQQMIQPGMIVGPGPGQGMGYPGPGPQNPRIHPMGPGAPGQPFIPYGANPNMPGYPQQPGHPQQYQMHPQQQFHPGQMHPQQQFHPGQPSYPPQGPGAGPRFPPVNRFEGDNRALQNVDDQNQPSTYESFQVNSAKCSSWMGTYLPCLGCCPNPYQRVPEGYSGIITRFGKFYKLIGPGLHYMLPELDQLFLIDKREKVAQLKQQNVVTMDNASLVIDAILYYKIVNSYKSKFAAANLAESIRDLGITTLRNVVGKMTVQQFLEQQDHLAEQIEQEITQVADTWGVKVKRLLVQDVFLPAQFRKTFSTGAVAKRISEAQVINSKVEVQVAKLMKEASDALNTEAAFQIRYIDALENIARSSNPKMIFFPADYRDVGTANDDLL